MRYAGVLHTYVPSEGPKIDLDVPRISPDEADKVFAYLMSGTVIVGARHLGPDEISGEDHQVPMGTRTDGKWVWRDDLAYYVKNYNLAPDDDFLEYLRGLSFTLAHPVTDHAAQEALAFIKPKATPRGTA